MRTLSFPLFGDTGIRQAICVVVCGSMRAVMIGIPRDGSVLVCMWRGCVVMVVNGNMIW